MSKQTFLVTITGDGGVLTDDFLYGAINQIRSSVPWPLIVEVHETTESTGELK